MGRINLIKGISRYVVIFLVVSGLAFVCPAVADEEEINVEEIPSPVGFDSGEVDISKAIRSYFDMTGKVDFRFDERIVISDRSFNFAEDARIPSVREGAYVGVKLNEGDEIVELRRLQSIPR